MTLKNKVQKPVELIRAIDDLQKELVVLKMQVFSSLPETEKTTIYPQPQILKESQNIRNEIWQKRYAKKMPGIS